MGENRYATKRSFDVYEGAANNKSGVAGAFAAGGLGWGAAMNMGASFNQTVGNPVGRTETKACVSCGTHIPLTSKFCPVCGSDNREIICECGKRLKPGTKFCPECGKKVQ